MSSIEHDDLHENTTTTAPAPDSRELALPTSATAPQWLELALSDLDAVYCDHLHCERKAAQSALSLVRNYPERADLVEAVTRLAHEETSHVVQVSQLLSRRNVSLRYDTGDDYAAGLRKHVRKQEPARLLDTLLVFALIEARSAQRLELLASALGEPEATLYRGLANAEHRHRDTFLRLARATTDAASYTARLHALAAAEAELIATLPLRARIH